MITVEVVSISGAVPPRRMSAQIDERGGNIGRSPDCTLVLTDEKRAVSRVHAELSFRDGKFHVVDQGTNPLKVNGVAPGKGNAMAIKDGDRLVIGPYELEVREPEPESPPTQQLRPPPRAAVPASPMSAAKAAPASGNPFDDLFGAAGAGSPAATGSGSVFADLGFGSDPAPAQASPSSRPAPAASDPFSGSGLPSDFDPMAAPVEPQPLLPPAGANLPDSAFDFDFAPSSPQAPGEGSLDALFGLSSGSSSDPFAGGPLGKPAPSGSGGSDSGLTQWLGGIKPAAAAPVSDHLPAINAAFEPPRALKPETPPLLPELDDDFAAAFAPPASAPVPAPPTPAKFELPQLKAETPLPPQPPPRPAAPPTATNPARALGPAAPPNELLAALLAGLDSPDLVIDELTPELMHKLGTLMHEATSGTVALLGARGTVKREMRADVTMIASGRNNPLKFSPDARLALRYLFGPQMPGFMQADEAMRDAYNDLRAHEFGFMAGLRAALGGVLKRFDPEQIETRLPDKGGFALIAANRKAKLWDLFAELYRQVSVEAEEDFHALFGREFLRAYEEHVDAMERGQKLQIKK